MTSKSRGHCDNVKVFNQEKSNQIREKSGKKQGIRLLKMCGHPDTYYFIYLPFRQIALICQCFVELYSPHLGGASSSNSNVYSGV